MQLNNERFSILFQLYAERKITQAEKNELYTLISQFKGDEEIHSALEKLYHDFVPTAAPLLAAQRETILAAIFNAAQPKKQSPISKINKIKYWAAAATVLLTMSVAFFFYNRKNPAATPAATAHHTILPGSNKAILTLSDGSQIELTGDKTSILAKQGQTVIGKSENGKLVYLNDKTEEDPNSTNYNTISVPRGGQYQVQLPDGTIVYLNSASSLRYPSVFNGAERTVELRGEGYFEVAKNKKQPFKVTIAGLEVKVLGTHFNIMGYPDENHLKVSLLEGAVSLNTGKVQSIMKPGQQALIRNAQNIELRTADMEQVVAWKNNYFMFDNEDLESVMRKLSRWYNVDIIYQGNFKEVLFSGTLSRFKEVDEILKMLELTEMVHFKTQGRRIIVMQ